MFRWLRERKLKKKSERATEYMLRRLYDEAAALPNDKSYSEEQAKIQRRIDAIYDSKARLETIETLYEALKWGIKVPDDKGWWKDDQPYTGGLSAGELLDTLHSERLTALGRAGVERLIREERRKSVEWWIRVITPILSALIALLSIVVALVSVSKQ